MDDAPVSSIVYRQASVQLGVVVSLVLRHLAVTRFRKWRTWLQNAFSHQNFRSENGHGANWMTLPLA